MNKNREIQVLDKEIHINESDYFSLTDIINIVILHPENPKYKDIITKDVTIQGIVKHIIHSF